MPQIIVTADGGAAFGDGAVTLRERVSVADFESQHFATQLAERIGWAVADAAREERKDADRADREARTNADDRAEQFDADRVTAPSPA